MRKLFSFRPTPLFCAMMLLFGSAKAQLVDEVLGQKRPKVQVLLKPYRIVDYKKDREVHNIGVGLHQTVLFENDTCVKFYWAVAPDRTEYFKGMLVGGGYKETNNGFVKDSLQLTFRELESGKATLYIASISESLTGNRDRSGMLVKKKTVVSVEQMPLLQQAILAEEKDTLRKKEWKDPQRNWVGGKQGQTTVLGWEK